MPYIQATDHTCPDCGEEQLAYKSSAPDHPRCWKEDCDGILDRADA